MNGIAEAIVVFWLVCAPVALLIERPWRAPGSRVWIAADMLLVSLLGPPIIAARALGL